MIIVIPSEVQKNSGSLLSHFFLNFTPAKPTAMSTEKTYTTFWDFYPYYLTEHARPVNRAMHFVGTTLVIACLIAAIVLQQWWLLVLIPLFGYGFAWVGHFILEKNRPATFKYPLYSLGSDFVMYYHIITAQINKKMDEAHKTIGATNKWK